MTFNITDRQVIIMLADTLTDEMNRRAIMEVQIEALQATLRDSGMGETLTAHTESHELYSKRSALAVRARTLRDITDLAKREWGMPSPEVPES